MRECSHNFLIFSIVAHDKNVVGSPLLAIKTSELLPTADESSAANFASNTRYINWAGFRCKTGLKFNEAIAIAAPLPIA